VPKLRQRGGRYLLSLFTAIFLATWQLFIETMIEGEIDAVISNKLGTLIDVILVPSLCYARFVIGAIFFRGAGIILTEKTAIWRARSRDWEIKWCYLEPKSRGWRFRSP
jgi:hypothetical protein